MPVVVWYDGRRAGAQSNPDMVDVDATWGSVEARWTPRGDRGAGEGVWFFRRNGNRQSRTETAVWIIITRLVVTFCVTDKIIIMYRKGGKGCGNALPRKKERRRTNPGTEAEPQQIVAQRLLSCLQYPVP